MTVVDTHVHFWDPSNLGYPWIAGVAPLNRAFMPADYSARALLPDVTKLVFVRAR